MIIIKEKLSEVDKILTKRNFKKIKDPKSCVIRKFHPSFMKTDDDDALNNFYTIDCDDEKAIYLKDKIIKTSPFKERSKMAFENTYQIINYRYFEEHENARGISTCFAANILAIHIINKQKEPFVLFSGENPTAETLIKNIFKASYEVKSNEIYDFEIGEILKFLVELKCV